MKNRSFLAPSLPLIFSSYQWLQTLPTTENKNSMESYGEGNGTPLHCSCLENPRDGEPGGLPSMGSHRVRHDWATSLSLFTFMHWRRNGNPLQCSCLENPWDSGAWWAAVYGNAQSRTGLKRLRAAVAAHPSKVMLKILQARLQKYVNHELPDVQAGFRKGRGTRDQIANIHWIMEKPREFQKKHLFVLYWLCQSLWLCGSQ